MKISQDGHDIFVENTDDKNITILTGKAPEPINPRHLAIEGTIEAPRAYIGTLGLNTGLITYSLESGVICYNSNPTMDKAVVVRGVLTLDPDYQAFRINQNHLWTKDSLIQLIKRYKSRFDDWQPLYASLRQFDVTIKTNVKDDQSTKERGNASRSFDRNVESSIPERFTLKIPLIKGQEPVPISVEIVIVPMDGTVHFSLENYMLEDTIKELKETLIFNELQGITAEIPKLPL